jgi:hypothetical protein
MHAGLGLWPGEDESLSERGVDPAVEASGQLERDVRSVMEFHERPVDIDQLCLTAQNTIDHLYSCSTQAICST